MHPDLGNLLLELKDLSLVARTDYEELLTNLSRMEVLLTFSQLFSQTKGRVPVIAGLPSSLPILLRSHTSSYNFLPGGVFQFSNVSTHSAQFLFPKPPHTLCSIISNLLSQMQICKSLSAFIVFSTHAFAQEAVRDLLSIREAIRLVEVVFQ